mmetsp:Transcript_12288/g.25453  ORF Transcript_12288/g.25453 Transcript_12288/m.25453 type:complete len:157 (+) Transcript_12288:1235-1705(+)
MLAIEDGIGTIEGQTIITFAEDRSIEVDRAVEGLTAGITGITGRRRSIPVSNAGRVIREKAIRPFSETNTLSGRHSVPALTALAAFADLGMLGGAASGMTVLGGRAEGVNEVALALRLPITGQPTGTGTSIGCDGSKGSKKNSTGNGLDDLHRSIV